MNKNHILIYQKLIDFMILFAYLEFLDIELSPSLDFFSIFLILKYMVISK
jgi:hypothetical protein